MKNEEKTILDDFSDYIVGKKLSAPTIFFLESTKYLSFVGSQALIFFGPIITSFVSSKKFYPIIELLESKQNIEYVIRKIEEKQALSIGEILNNE